jgi:hypothetical protein
MITLLLIIILGLKHTIYDLAAMRDTKLKLYNFLVSREKLQTALCKVTGI